MRSCQNKKQNLQICNCTYDPCERKGMCCECLSYHRSKHELPACYFPADKEKTFDRSINNFRKDR